MILKPKRRVVSRGPASQPGARALLAEDAARRRRQAPALADRVGALIGRRGEKRKGDER